MKLRVVLLVLAGLCVAVVLVLFLGFQPQPFPAGSASAARLAEGTYKVVKQNVTLTDEQRVTAANGDFPGSDRRELGGAVFYPAQGGSFPLVVHSHGFTSTHDSGAYLAQHLASHGFVVVAVNFPLTFLRAPGGPTVRDVVNQPGDVSFLIDTLTAQSATAGHALAGKIDPERIAVMGISLGGLTSTLLAYHPELGDSRIDVAISIAGPTASFGPRFFAGNRLPFLMLAGSRDVLVPWEAHAAPLLAKAENSTLVTIDGGSHTGFSGVTAHMRWLRNPDVIGCWAVQRNLNSGDLAVLGEVLGSAELDIATAAADDLCAVDELPDAMNVLRQQMIARVVIRAFLEQHLAREAQVREAARSYLASSLAGDLEEVSVAASVNTTGAGALAD